MSNAIIVHDHWLRLAPIAAPGCDCCSGPATIVHIREYKTDAIANETELYCEDCCPIVIVKQSGFQPIPERPGYLMLTERMYL